MKFIPIFALIATAATLVTPQAKADKESRALIGGLIGGVIIGSVLADDDHRVSTSVTIGHRGHRGHHGGYYKWVTVKTWVPGYHERRRDHCGNRYRSWVPGHYSYTKKKVWVSESRYDRHSYRHDRYDRRERHDRYERRHDSRRGSDYRADRRDNRRDERVGYGRNRDF